MCAGAKSILDIGLTLEFLETQGVTVASFQHDEFPAFFVRNSGFQTPIRVDTHREAAAIIGMSVSSVCERISHHD